MKKQRALTLIELLIASSIFVVIMVTIYSAFQSGIFGYRNIEETISIYQTARSILEPINLDLRNVFPYSSNDTKFKGSENEMCFLTLVDTYDVAKEKFIRDFAFVSYKLEGSKLMRLSKRNQEALKEDSKVEPEEMANNLEIKFEYLFPGQQEMKFNKFWPIKPDEGNKALPIAVRVNLTIKNKITQSFKRTIYLPLAE